MHIQGTLFPWLTEELGPLTKKQQQLITVLEVARAKKKAKEKRAAEHEKKAKGKAKRGRPKRGEERPPPKEQTRLEK